MDDIDSVVVENIGPTKDLVGSPFLKDPSVYT